jgi:hypothetical protein
MRTFATLALAGAASLAVATFDAGHSAIDEAFAGRIW